MRKGNDWKLVIYTVYFIVVHVCVYVWVELQDESVRKIRKIDLVTPCY